MNRKLFWSILIVLLAYSIPIVTGLVVTHVPEVALGYLSMLIQFVILWLNWHDGENPEATINVSLLVLALGVLVAIVTAISAVPEMLFLTIVMFIVSLCFYGMTD